MMKNFFKLLAQLFLIDTKTNKPSHTKMWSNIGYGCMCFTFIYAVMNGSSVDVMIWALFGVVVIGNRTIVKLFNPTAKEPTDPIDNDIPKP